MSNLTILNTTIRTLDGLFSLNDFHKVSGEKPNHRPSLFIRNEQTKDLIAEINNGNDLSTNSILAHKSLKGGLSAGVWACEELVIAYATWISPKFHLIVLRAFLNMHKNEPKQLSLPEPSKKYTFEFTEAELKKLAWLWKIAELMRGQLYALYEPLKQLGSHHAPNIYSESREYQLPIETCRKILVKLTKDIQTDKLNSNGWNNIIHELRKGETNTLY